MVGVVEQFDESMVGYAYRTDEEIGVFLDCSYLEGVFHCVGRVAVDSLHSQRVECKTVFATRYPFVFNR